ncbi:hypothetical protein [Azotobacter armeniacus]
MDLRLSGRTILTDEALELRLINRVLPQESFKGACWAQLQPLVMLLQRIKRQVVRASHRPTRKQCRRQTPDFTEGVASLLEKRPPRFRLR